MKRSSIKSSRLALFAAGAAALLFASVDKADALVSPTVLGMNQYEPIDLTSVVTSETDCPCLVSDNNVQYKWFLFNNTLTQYSLTNCPQTFCNLRVGLETLPLRDNANGTRPNFMFRGVTGYPVLAPATNGNTYTSTVKDYTQYSVFYQQVIWIKGVSTEFISDRAPVDIHIENAIFTGDGNRHGAGIAFTYRIPAGSTVTVTNNYFNGYYAQGLRNNYGLLMVNGIFPNTACSVCFTTVVLEDLTQISVSNNRFYFPCPTGGGVPSGYFPFSSRVLNPTSTNIYPSQCSPVVLAGVQMYGGQLNITENDFGNTMNVAGTGYIAAPFFSFVTAIPGAFEEETYDGPPAEVPELRIDSNVGMNSGANINSMFMLNLSVSEFNLDDNHTMAGGRIVIRNHTIATTSQLGYTVPAMYAVVNVTTETYYPALVRVYHNTINQVSGMSPFNVGFANSNATGSSLQFGPNTVNNYQPATGTNNGVRPAVNIQSLRLLSDALVGFVNNTITGVPSGKTAFQFGKFRPIVEEGADFVFGGNVVDGTIFAADLDTFRTRIPLLLPTNDYVSAAYCYTCGNEALNYCTFRTEIVPYFSNALLCGFDKYE